VWFQDHENKNNITKCKVIESKVPYELLKIILINFVHMSSLNKIYVKWHNETNMFVNMNKNENDWKKPLMFIKNYNVHMFWPKMI
jgi:hypothetical protein